ncbi:unnamed protein product [Symbiodinium sp. KB8]|nr:unnamed protein product [Symbiodinium sp. KB8]
MQDAELLMKAEDLICEVEARRCDENLSKLEAFDTVQGLLAGGEARDLFLWFLRAQLERSPTITEEVPLVPNRLVAMALLAFEPVSAVAGCRAFLRRAGFRGGDAAEVRQGQVRQVHIQWALSYQVPRPPGNPESALPNCSGSSRKYLMHIAGAYFQCQRVGAMAMQVHGVVTFCFISFDKSTVQCVFSFQAKISALKDKFSNFQAQWDEDTRHGQLPQTIVDTSRLAQESHSVRANMMKAVESVQTEVHRRAEANRAMASMFDAQVHAIQDRLEAVFTAKLDQLDSGLELLGNRMAAVERDFAETREKQIRDIDKRKALLSKDVFECVAAHQQEKADRKASCAACSKSLSEFEAQTSAALKAQAQRREQKYQNLRAELDNIKQQRDSGDDTITSYIDQKVAAVEASLQVETAQRSQANDDILQALRHYTTCLQDALRIINQH